MTAARAVARAALVLVIVAAVLWAVFGPQGFWTVLWLVAVFAVVTGAVLAAGAVLGVSALQPKNDGADQ